MKNILITGGGMGNKGAQSMTFICVSELKKRYPEDRIVLLTLANDDYSKFSFDVQLISYPALKYLVDEMNGIHRILRRISRKKVDEIECLYTNARMLIDISGYALGSNWPDATVDYYLSCFECARKYNVPVYVMPQSFGPFDYAKDSATFMRIQSTMSYPKIVYAREKEGYELLKDLFGLSNLHQSCDIVLRSRKISPQDVYKKVEHRKMPVIIHGSAAVIPNARNFDHAERQTILEYYQTAIRTLLECKHYVYLLHHSSEDSAICTELKALFNDVDDVILINSDFDCFEYEDLVGKFDYILASRYHSLIHALKNGTPCIAMGWAIKYKELFDLLEQQDCVLDIRDAIKPSEIKAAIKEMDISFMDRKQEIKNRVDALQKECLFDDMIAVEASNGREPD